MTNASYCAFENTRDDMNKCLKKLEEHDYDLNLIKSNYGENEYNAALRFVQICKIVQENICILDRDNYEHV